MKNNLISLTIWCFFRECGIVSIRKELIYNFEQTTTEDIHKFSKDKEDSSVNGDLYYLKRKERCHNSFVYFFDLYLYLKQCKNILPNAVVPYQLNHYCDNIILNRTHWRFNKKNINVEKDQIHSCMQLLCKRGWLRHFTLYVCARAHTYNVKCLLNITSIMTDLCHRK